MFCQASERTITWLSCPAQTGSICPPWRVWCCCQNGGSPGMKEKHVKGFSDNSKRKEVCFLLENLQFLDWSACWRCGSWSDSRPRWCRRHRNHHQPPLQMRISQKSTHSHKRTHPKSLAKLRNYLPDQNPRQKTRTLDVWPGQTAPTAGEESDWWTASMAQTGPETHHVCCFQ